MNGWVRSFLTILVGLSLTNCTFKIGWFDQYRAQRAIKNQNFESAVVILSSIIQHDPDSDEALKAARLGASVAHFEAKDYVHALEFYKQIVLSSPDVEERKTSQKYIAQIQFENLNDYNQAVIEYEKLLRLNLGPAEAFRYRMNLAKSYFYLNDTEQTLIEIDMILNKTILPDEAFEAKVLRANTEVAAKRNKEAAVMWKNILEEFPEKSKKEKIALNLAVVYEEMNDFENAIEVLNSLRDGSPHQDFLDLRISRLKERMDNQPGANGLRR